MILRGNQRPEEKEVKLRSQLTGCLHRRRNLSSPFRPRLAHMIECRCHSYAQQQIWTVITATEIEHKNGYTPTTKKRNSTRFDSTGFLDIEAKRTTNHRNRSLATEEEHVNKCWHGKGGEARKLFSFLSPCGRMLRRTHSLSPGHRRNGN